MIGQHKRNFTIVKYQESWRELFELEAKRLKDALRDNILEIEHHGSTSVPGIFAKPIIDILVAVESLEHAVKLIPLIEEIGYLYRDHDTIHERMFFAKESSPEFRTYHLSLTKLNSTFWINHLAFRDYLRENEETAREYVELKRRIAKEYDRTNVVGIDAKTEFVTRVLKLANK